MGQARPTPPKALPPTPLTSRAPVTAPAGTLPVPTSTGHTGHTPTSPSHSRVTSVPATASEMPQGAFPTTDHQLIPSATHTAASAVIPSPTMGPSSANTPSETVSNTCANCRQPISGKGINALEQRWHTECFVCAHCRLPFQGSYVPYQGKPYCIDDFNRHSFQFFCHPIPSNTD